MIAAGCMPTTPFVCVLQNPLDYAYDSLTLQAVHKKNLDICDVTFSNKDNGALFQDILRLTLHCDSTFAWKHISCISRDTSYGNWTVANNVIHLTTSKKIKEIVTRQALGDLFGDYIDLSNTTLFFRDSFVVWHRTEKWTDTLYRH